jgi:hypothetical protein
VPRVPSAKSAKCQECQVPRVPRVPRVPSAKSAKCQECQVPRVPRFARQNREPFRTYTHRTICSAHNFVFVLHYLNMSNIIPPQNISENVSSSRPDPGTEPHSQTLLPSSNPAMGVGLTTNVELELKETRAYLSTCLNLGQVSLQQFEEVCCIMMCMVIFCSYR